MYDQHDFFPMHCFICLNLGNNTSLLLNFLMQIVEREVFSCEKYRCSCIYFSVTFQILEIDDANSAIFSLDRVGSVSPWPFYIKLLSLALNARDRNREV